MRRVAALLMVPLLLVAGCGGGDGDDGDDKAGSQLPKVSGAVGEKPTIAIPKGDPSKTLESRTITEGKGPVVEKGQLLVAHYLGEIWRDGKVFDNSYDRKAPAGFPIGVGKVIPGWDQKLLGVKAGSRVMLSIPPEAGYGAKGESRAGIKGDDTLVFVVDVLGSYTPDAGAEGKPVTASAAAGQPVVGGAPGKKPTLTVPKTAPPKQLVLRTLVQGDGPAAKKGQVVVHHYAAAAWSTGKPLDSSWEQRQGGAMPVALSIGTGQLLPGWDEALTGAKAGSRILAVIPPEKGLGKQGKPDVGIKANETLVFVFDVLGVH